MINVLAKIYENSPRARFVVTIPVVGPAIHEYLMAKAKSTLITPFEKLWGFKYDSVYIVCSQLTESEVRQEPEPGEFLYLGKYGDIDSFLELLTSLGKLFPRLNVKFCTDEEFDKLPGNQYRNNLILIGGPDYNKITRVFMQYTPFKFSEKEGVAVLQHKKSNQLFESKFIKHEGIEEVTDYGFFLKMPNPNNVTKKLIMINGIHTYGVYGATKCFLSQDEHEIDVSSANCKNVIDELGDDPHYAVILEIKSINKKVGIPVIKKEELIRI